MQNDKVHKHFFTLEEMGFLDKVNSCYLTRTLLHAVNKFVAVLTVIQQEPSKWEGFHLVSASCILGRKFYF